MHRCIGVPEIFQIISNDLDKPSCLAMALTSRTFLEPALDSLWFSIESFEPIIACLPKNAWKRHPSYESTVVSEYHHLSTLEKLILIPQTTGRTLEPVDLRRYLTFYAPRIRRIFFDFDLDRNLYLSIEALQALQLSTNHRCGALAPLLQHFRWPLYDSIDQAFGGDFANKLYPFMSLFIPDNLVSMDIGCHRHPAAFNPLFMSSLRSATGRLTSLKRLDIGGNGREDVNRDRFVTSSAWGGLEAVTIGKHEAEVIIHLASLPRLRTLQIDMPGRVPTLRTSNTGLFPSLQILKTECWSLAYAEDILQYLPPNNVVHTLAFTCEFSNSRDEYEDPLLLVGRYCNSHILERLELRDLGRRYIRSFALDKAVEPAFASQEPFDLDPLYNFRKLKHLEVNIMGGIRVAPDDIQRIHASWPEIQYLDVRSSLSISDRLPLLNHHHIIDLLAEIPSIRTLGLRFDATNIAEQEPIPDKLFLLNKLCVGETPLCSPARVLNFLKTYFPKLRDLETHYGLTSRDAMVAEDHVMNQRWGLVIRRWKEHALA